MLQPSALFSKVHLHVDMEAMGLHTVIARVMTFAAAVLLAVVAWRWCRKQ